MAEDKLHFFKANVRHSFSVRFFFGDRDGVVLNSARQLVEVKESNLKEFKQVNKPAILNGLLIEVDEPVETWETDNALSDADIADLLSNWLKFKNRIDSIDSLPILYKLQDAANEKGSAKRITALIAARIAAVEPQAEEITREDMAGSYDEGQVVSSSS